MATDSSFTPPPRNLRNTSGRRKLVYILGGFLVVAAVAIGAYWWTSRSATPPAKHHEIAGGRGAPWTPVAQPVSARLPAPRAKPRDTARRLVSTTGASAVADPALTAPIAITNQFGGMPSLLASKQGQTQAAKAGGDDDDSGGGGEEDNPLSHALKRSNLGATSMGHIDRDYLYTISAGRHLPCNMKTKINTQLPGFVSCDIQGDVMNDGGTGLLLRNGTHVFGEYKSALLHGNDRAFILWRRLRTDDTPPCKIEINSPAADALGAAGKPVIANEHLLETFLATAVYTLLEAGPALAIAAISSGNHNNNNNNALNYYAFNQLSNPTQNMGSRMLQERMNRPPTGEANPGEPVMIFVGSDVNVKHCVRFDIRDAAR